MAGGLRFNAAGRVFTKRGQNFVSDAGVCEDCNCDNPPGSGKNTTFCGGCAGGIAAGSVLLSFVGITYASCSDFTPPGTGGNGLVTSVAKTGSGSLGSYCTLGGCGADLFGTFDTSLLNLKSHLYPGAGCTGTPYTNTYSDLYWRYGRQYDSSGPYGWTVVSANGGVNGSVIWFYGFTETDGDCLTAATVNNLITAGTKYKPTGPASGTPFFVPEIGWSSLTVGGASGGSCIITPQLKLCA